MVMSWVNEDDGGTEIFDSVEDGYISHHFTPLISDQNQISLSLPLNGHGENKDLELPVPLQFDQIGRFNEEWFWVFGYGTTSVLVIIANTMMLCSIIKNAFLHTNTHRALAVLSVRNIVRALFTLAVVYTTRWNHPKESWKYSTVNSTKLGMPLACDVFSALDTFLLTLPMFILTALAIHMFTRLPSPQFSDTSHPHNRQEIKVYGGRKSGNKYTPALNTSLLPREPIWLGFILPTLPLLFSGLVICPILLLHLTHKLQAIPEKYICEDTAQHLTFDISLLILAFALPFLLVFFLTFGLIFRRCLRCSVGHCCNSWCKEEVVLVLQFILQTIVQLMLYVPLIMSFAKKINSNWSTSLFQVIQIGPFNMSLSWIFEQEIARAIEMANGFLLPILCYLCLPAYRQFCTEPDPDDLKLSTPKVKSKRNEYAARGVKTSSSYGPQIRNNNDVHLLRSDQHVLNIEGPIMSSIAAPGATGSSATSGISQPSMSKRASPNLNKDSSVYKVKEDPI